MLKILVLITIFALSVYAAGDATFEAVKRDLNVPAVIMFFILLLELLGITFWAAKEQNLQVILYSRWRNYRFSKWFSYRWRLYVSCSFLGVSGLIYMKGYDGVIYAVSFLVGWPVILFFMAEKLRNLGKFTFADIAAYRLGQKEIRTLAAFGSISVVILYLIAQMVGAGKLIQVLFGMEYEYAVFMVGALMIILCYFWWYACNYLGKIIKACLLLSGVSFMAIMVYIILISHLSL